ncbi:two-component system sensor histidine kinase YesM [Paenibacillus phyllosphaerae]|uniref:histidine kinase n=1 Tax=Paenibacillus phyllosphaerae TaxID=274593 RepID=A0A7W5B3R1_9BACL|nr:sensor histidine kinase [Paenibacillus phyllosphaerae]MBB3113768.1 two-component system sensor histidine kinase YesM [Paenibacillus phyllosphaerae]
MPIRWLSPVTAWYARIQIKRKVIVAYLPLIILSLFILGLISNQLFSRSIIERTKQNVQDESALMVAKLDSTMSNMEICANLLITDLNRLFESYPAAADRTAIEEVRLRNLLQSRLSIDVALFPEVAAAVFVGTDGTVHTSYSSANDETQIVKNGLVEQLMAAGSYGQTHWLPMERRNYLTSDPEVPVLTLGKVMTDINTGRTLGSLFLLVQESTISGFLGSGGDMEQKQYYLVDEDMSIIASPNEALVLTSAVNRPEFELLRENPITSEIVKQGGERNLVTVSTYPELGWRLVNLTSIDLLTKDIRQNGWLTVLIGLICVILSWLAANGLSKLIVGPLLQLVKAMRRVMDGDLAVHAPIRTQDEVGLLAKAFNTMVQRIQELVIKVEEEQARKREYELALITAQVKPHFLYNTLDTIYVLNDMDRHEEARDTTKALADFYRMVLSKGRELILLGQEAKITSDYLSIMQVRYNEVFRYEIHIPAELAGAPIPKLSLQPLVENAIYHGLKTKGELGLIRITAYEEAGKVVVAVEDDGVGMDEQQLAEVRYARADEDGQQGQRSIGLYSVEERLKLYFGEEYSMSITSELGQGTRVVLTVPALRSGGGAGNV